jgi:hypothetical protein
LHHIRRAAKLSRNVGRAAVAVAATIAIVRQRRPKRGNP